MHTSAVAGTSCLPFAAAAQDSRSASPTTRLIPYTAVLPDAIAGAPGARTVTFALFDEADGGTLLWSESQVVSVDARGRYTAHLGAVTALPLEIFRTEQARWLEVTVDGRALPRTMLVAVPYALRAADAETLGGKPLSDFVLTDGSGRRVRADGTHVDEPAVDGTGVPGQLAKWSTDTVLSSSIITETPANRIGVATADPTGGGTVDSLFTIGNPDNNTALAVLSSAPGSLGRRFAPNTLPNGGWRMYDGGGTRWNPGLTQFNGWVGVGVDVPTARLEVDTEGKSTDAIKGTASVMNKSGVLGITTSFGFGVRGVSNAAFPGGIGVQGSAINNGVGVKGNSDTSTGVSGTSQSGAGVAGASNSGVGVFGQSGTGLAGQFNGNVTVSGTLTKGGGAFEIDHPLDPSNKYLRHSFVESPDMMNVYNGNATLDAGGEAWVTLPDWFEALNRDFRYQLTAIGAPGPNLHVAAKISGNRFRIGGGTAGAEVSWQVTGIRHDAWANANRIVVEEEKPARDSGFYVHPEALGVPAEPGAPSLRPVVIHKKK